MMLRVVGITAIVLATVAVSREVNAAVLCKKHSGKLFVRDSECKKKETLVTAAEIGAQGPQGDQGPQGLPGSARAWALIEPDGTVFSTGGSVAVTWTVTKAGTGEYCLATSPNLLGNYDPVVATIHGPDNTFGQISVNTEYGSDCNPYGGHGVFTANTSGVATDQWFLVAVL